MAGQSGSTRTGSTAEVAAPRTGPPGLAAGDRRRIVRRQPLPGGRAIVGGLLLAVAALGTFLTWQEASGTPDRSYAVAVHPIPPGGRVDADDVRLEPIDLPSDVAAAAFTSLGSVVGRIALGPIGEGELIQAAQVSSAGSADPSVEVSFAIDRDRAVDGLLRPGDRVDVFATYDDHTTPVAEGVQVVSISAGDGSSFGTGSQLTVTVALTDPERRVDLIHAIRAGEVTLARSTGVGEGGQPPGDAFTPGAEAPTGGESTAGGASGGA